MVEDVDGNTIFDNTVVIDKNGNKYCMRYFVEYGSWGICSCNGKNPVLFAKHGVTIEGMVKHLEIRVCKSIAERVSDRILNAITRREERKREQEMER